MGGRYHTIQVDFNECSDVAAVFESDAVEGLLLMAESSLESFSFFSLVAFDVLKSKAVPGVLGVFPEDPKEAKAPDPKPKAEEAPDEGEAMLVESGVMALKGLERPWEEVSPPYLLEEL